VSERFHEQSWRRAHRGGYAEDHLWWAAAPFLDLDDAASIRRARGIAPERALMRSAMDATFVRELSAALREFDMLEPWLTEGHWDEHYWDDVAATVADAVGPQPSRTQVVTALRTALSALFGELVSDNGLFRDDLDRRLDLIAGRVRA
jgi:hypothetical protein